jgi:hypothetical protein
LDRIFDVNRRGFKFHDGSTLTDIGALSNIREFYWNDKLRIDMADWAHRYHLLALWGLGFLLSYPLGESEVIKGRDKMSEFYRFLLGIYDSLSSDELMIVSKYVLSYTGDSELPVDQYVLNTKSVKQAKTVIVSELSSEVEKVIKNMKDWTDEDFWNEMTELYLRCKSADDIKSVKSILEMKAKTMGLMNDVQPVNNNIMIMTDKAVQELNRLGFITRRGLS